MSFAIRLLRSSDYEQWCQMRAQLWNDVPSAELELETPDWIAGKNCAVFVAENAAGVLCGFLEVAIRPSDVNGTTGRFGYVEGWYVASTARRQGIGRSLVDAAESWSKSQGCDEIHSDAHIENHVSEAAHRAMGFSEVERLVHFSKRLL